MRTLIIQSYRRHDRARWIEACLDSVRDWATLRGYAYEFVDDRLFDYAPEWVRQRCGGQILPITDVARLYLLRDYLQRDWDRVVWIDADVLVFAEDRFVLDDHAAYALCHELWLRVEADGEIRMGEAVNNAVLLVQRGHPMLDFWIFATAEILRNRTPQQINSLTVGTTFLTNLGRALPLRVLRNVGLFTPPLIRDLAAGGGAILDHWAARCAEPIGAANLCASMQGREFSDARVDAADMLRAVEILSGTRGEVVNGRLTAAA